MSDAIKEIDEAIAKLLAARAEIVEGLELLEEAYPLTEEKDLYYRDPAS